MTDSRDLLFELGSEELPQKSLLSLRDALRDNVTAGLLKAELNHGEIESFATPRRLALLIRELDSKQPDKLTEKRGPAVKAAFNDDGTLTKAAEGFARRCGTSFDRLDILKTDKGQWLGFKKEVVGSATTALIPGIITDALEALPIARRMRWGALSTEFVRPVHWAVLLFGEELVDAEILGVQTGRQTRGHRFHCSDWLEIDRPSNYREILRCEGKVIVDFDERKETVRRSAVEAAKTIDGNALIDEELLNEVTALLEWPVSVTGTIDNDYLKLPVEVLITTMQSNQKYFPVQNGRGNLSPNFIALSNLDSKHPDSVRRGNERVIRPRLADAEFFWRQDRKNSLESRVVMLSGIVFQEKLGTLADKTHRVKQLTRRIAEILKIDSSDVSRAALLAKADLLTAMVGEFASLQGTMGRYYALADGENQDVAAALEEQYLPKQAGGLLPETKTGQILALSEKIDTVVGIFSAGLIPSGDKDPYGLRRAVLGTLRIIIEKNLHLDLKGLIEFSVGLFCHEFDRMSLKQTVHDFFLDRLKSYCLVKGYRPDEFDAVQSVAPNQPLDFEMRLRAVKEFRSLPEASSLASANKRIRNILRRSEAGEIPEINPSMLVDAQEKNLFELVSHANDTVKPLLSSRSYAQALTCLAGLRDSVDAFFDNVLVMTEDRQLQLNRLALLTLIESLFLKIADISKLQ